MSNPTELPDLDKLSAEALECLHTLQYLLSEPEKQLVLAELARRAQPEVEASANALERLRHSDPNFVAHLERTSEDVAKWPDWKRNLWLSPKKPEGEAPQAVHSRFGSPEMQARILSNLGAATLSPLCGAQPAESGKEATKRPRGWLAGTGSDCSEDMYFRLEDAQRECDQHNQYERSRPDFDEDNLREPEPVYSAAQQAAAPVDCSGTPSSCPDNEGYGCHCSAPGTPEAPIVADWKPCNPVCDESPGMRNANCACDAAKTSICRQRAAQLDGGQEGSAT